MFATSRAEAVSTNVNRDRKSYTQDLIRVFDEKHSSETAGLFIATFFNPLNVWIVVNKSDGSTEVFIIENSSFSRMILNSNGRKV